MTTPRLTTLLLTLATLLIPPAPLAAAQRARGAAGVNRRELAARVRAEFLHAWRGYERHAWGHDELRPLSKTARDWYGEPLLMTQVDALDTLFIMGLGEEDSPRPSNTFTSSSRRRARSTSVTSSSTPRRTR